MPIHMPYDPNKVIEDFGWLWLDDGPMGPDWHLIQTIEDAETDQLMIWFVGEGDGTTSYSEKAYIYAGVAYLPALKPTSVPDESDQLEITVRLENGASVSHSFGDAASAAATARATMAALQIGRAENQSP